MLRAEEIVEMFKGKENTPTFRRDFKKALAVIEEYAKREAELGESSFLLGYREGFDSIRLTSKYKVPGLTKYSFFNKTYYVQFEKYSLADMSAALIKELESHGYITKVTSPVPSLFVLFDLGELLEKKY